MRKAQDEQDRAAKLIQFDEHRRLERPLFHFAPPCGWMNDPNGFSFFAGACHLFYQTNPFSTRWDAIHWGHATSHDMVFWQGERVALAPDSPFDAAGCFSGTAVDKGGKHVLAYTGVHMENGKMVQEQCIATGDGRVYTKYAGNPVIRAEQVPFEFVRGDFRDPKLWFSGGTYYLAAVVKKADGCGAIVLFKSADAQSWQFVSVVDESRDGLSGMWECPDLFSLGGKDVMIFCAQGMRANDKLGFFEGNNCVYTTGVFDKTTGKFMRERRVENGYTAAMVDYGIDFYAAQTTLTPDGRRVMIAWMNNWESLITPEGYSWSGMMSFPRELKIRGGRLLQQPVREIETLRLKRGAGVFEPNAAKVYIEELSCRHFDATFTLEASAGEEGVFRVEFAASQDGRYKITLAYDAATQLLSFDRRHSLLSGGKIPIRSVKVPSDSRGIVTLRLLADTCSLEVFANDGETAFTNTFFVPAEAVRFSVAQGLKTSVRYEFFTLGKLGKPTQTGGIQ